MSGIHHAGQRPKRGHAGLRRDPETEDDPAKASAFQAKKEARRLRKAKRGSKR